MVLGAVGRVLSLVTAGETAPLVIERQGSFFVGGRQLRAETLSTLPQYPATGTITVDQVYVRYQIPAGSAGHCPVTLIHGCCLTGKTWETTPDGRMGWDEYFVRRGHPTYVVDQAWRGRSAWSPAAINAVKTGARVADALPTVFSASQEAAWAIFRFGPEYPQRFPGVLYPVEAEAELWKQLVPDWWADLPTPNPTVPGLSELAHRLDGTVLVSHSQSGIYPFHTAVQDSRGIAGIIALEPAAVPEPTGDLRPFTSMPILILFGDYVGESARWAPRLELCRAFAAAVNAAGGRAELMLLPEMGIRGNSHMLMQDRNSLQIADLLLDWMDRCVGTRTGP